MQPQQYEEMVTSGLQILGIMWGWIGLLFIGLGIFWCIDRFSACKRLKKTIEGIVEGGR